MIAVHSRFPAAHRVLLEEAPRGGEGGAVHDRFAAILHRRYEAIVKANCRGTSAPRNPGVVHCAASQGTLRTQSLRRELLRLADSYLV
jgi:hypothetical protein